MKNINDRNKIVNCMTNWEKEDELRTAGVLTKYFPYTEDDNSEEITDWYDKYINGVKNTDLKKEIDDYFRIIFKK